MGIDRTDLIPEGVKTVETEEKASDFVLSAQNNLGSVPSVPVFVWCW